MFISKNDQINTTKFNVVTVRCLYNCRTQISGYSASDMPVQLPITTRQNWTMSSQSN